MPSTPDTRNDPHDVLEISPDVVMAARAAADFPSLAPEAASQGFDRSPRVESDFAAAPAPRLDTTFRASDVNERSRGRSRWLRTASLAFLLAFGSAFATAGWEMYGKDARAMVSSLPVVPTLTSLWPGQPDAASSPPAVADQAVATTAAATPTASGPPLAPALPSDAAQTLQSMARDIASLTQQVGELKAGIAQLKASQDQAAREPTARVADARPVEPRIAEPRPKLLGAPPKPLGAIVQRKPKPVGYPSYPQTAAAPLPPPSGAPAPVQLQPAQPEADNVVRPPMPLR